MGGSPCVVVIVLPAWLMSIRWDDWQRHSLLGRPDKLFFPKTFEPVSLVQVLKIGSEHLAPKDVGMCVLSEGSEALSLVDLGLWAS